MLVNQEESNDATNLPTGVMRIVNDELVFADRMNSAYLECEQLRMSKELKFEYLRVNIKNPRVRLAPLNGMSPIYNR